MTATFDGLPVALLARRWSVPQVRALRTTPSCMDTVHALGAEGAPAGTVVVAEEQTAGRGRDGRTWHSPLGGAWLALLLRPSEAAVGVLSIRAGLVVADAIDELLGVARTRVKWPNDVLLEDRKVAGVLCESRWQGDALQWLALGIGGVLFRTIQLFFIKDVQTGLVWATKILTDPLHDIKLYHKAPLALLRGELIDPHIGSEWDEEEAEELPHAG